MEAVDELANHPTGDLTPSQEDIAITRRLKECGELLGIKILDHVRPKGKAELSKVSPELSPELFLEKEVRT